MQRKSRIEKLRSILNERKLDALLVTNMSNVFYLSGFTGSTAAFVIDSDSSTILVDPRYTTQAKRESPEAEVVEYRHKTTIVAAAELMSERNYDAVGFEAEHLTVAKYRQLRSKTPKSTSLKSTTNIVQNIRQVKDQNEIELIRKAVQIVDATFLHVIGEIQAGLSEKEVALMIDTTMRRFGADKRGFETIAATGPNSACPHASPTDATVRDGHFLKMDFGAELNHYNSDITRTVVIGNATDKHREVYQTVLDAQLKSIEAIKPGKTGKEIDSVARDYIASRGYGKNFGHGLGHALGVDVHDGPGLSQLSDIVLEPGMVLTVEPGIYIEDWGGVRIEDDVVVTDTGVEILNSAPKELIVI